MRRMFMVPQVFHRKGAIPWDVQATSVTPICYAFMQMFKGTVLLAVICTLGSAASLTGCREARPVVGDNVYTYRAPHPDGIGKVYLGREIAHVMSASGGAWLERSSRQQEEDAEAAIVRMPLSPGSVVADIGAGTG